MWFHLWSIAISDDASQRPYQLRRISSAKHRAHDGIVIWSLCAICFRNWKECHRTAIISVSRSSITPALTYTKSCFVVQKMGVSASNSRSLQKWDFGAGRCTGCPSSINSKSCHWMIWWFHLKSFKKITSAFSAPTQAKVDEAGLLNDLKTTFKGFRRNVLPVFAGPVIKMFLCFPLPFSKRFITALVKTSMEMSFHVSSCLAHCSHRPLQCSLHGLSRTFSKISTLDSLLLSNTSLAFSISHAVAMTSSTTFVPLLTMNSARSVFPSAFWALASASNSVRVFICFETIMVDTSKELRRWDRLRLADLLADCLLGEEPPSSCPSTPSSSPLLLHVVFSRELDWLTMF